MGNVDAFLKSLVTFDKDNVPLNCVERVRSRLAPTLHAACWPSWLVHTASRAQSVCSAWSYRTDGHHGLSTSARRSHVQVEKDYLSSPSFKPEIIRSKSGAAAGLCGWVVNICKYFRIYQARHPVSAPAGRSNALASANKGHSPPSSATAPLSGTLVYRSHCAVATEDPKTASYCALC